MQTGLFLFFFSFICFLSQGIHAQALPHFPDASHFTTVSGALTRFDTTQPVIWLVFTGGDYSDGGDIIARALKKKHVKAHFFFTGDFLRNPDNNKLVRKLMAQGHYIGPHSDQHLLYAPWDDRDKLLVSKDSFLVDLANNYTELEQFGITRAKAPFSIPPYEWYNDTISAWTLESGSILVNYSPGTRSAADYTTPEMPNYLSSEVIFQSILDYEEKSTNGMNGFILLMHIGTHPDRTDKFYFALPGLIDTLQKRGYQFGFMPDLLKH